MRALLRTIILWAIPELSPILDRQEPEYDPATLDRIAAEQKGG